MVYSAWLHRRILGISSCPTEENRFRVTPTIYGTGHAGVRYGALYSMLFRKKEAVRGVYRDLPETSSVTLEDS